MRREAFDTPGEVTLDLRVTQGRVELEAVPGATTTEVELDARGSDEEVSELLEEARVESRERQGGHEVVVHVEDRHRRGFAFWRRVEIRLKISLPEGAKVQFEGASADLRRWRPLAFRDHPSFPGARASWTDCIRSRVRSRSGLLRFSPESLRKRGDCRWIGSIARWRAAASA